MSGHKQIQRINLQIIKTYKLQRSPIISISLDHQQGQEHLYFGTCEEPSNRLAQYHDLNLFVNKAFYFVHRNTQEVYQGLLPIMYYAFYKNQFTNMIFLGPPGITQFIMQTRYIIGIRNFAFGAMDLNKNMIIKEQKFGVGDKNSFLEMLKAANEKQMQSLKGINQFFSDKKPQNYVNPIQLVYQNKYLSLQYSKVRPFFGNNPNLTQYLVTFKVDTFVDKELLKKLKISLSRIPDIREGKFNYNGRFIQYDEIKKTNYELIQQAILLLDFKTEIEIQDFTKNIFPQLQEELSIYNMEFQNSLKDQKLDQTLLIIHYADKQLLESNQYTNLIDQLKLLNYKLIHIITSTEYYFQFNESNYQQNLSYYYLDYLKIMKDNMPSLFKRQMEYNQFKDRLYLTNLNSLWPNQVKYLPIKMNTLQITKGVLTFQNLNQKQLIQYSLKGEAQKKLIRLYNSIPKTKSESYEIVMLGTSSSIETLSRNASGIYVNLTNVSILMDCGQNTLNQFYFSCKDYQKFEHQLKCINVIYISHSHNDHHQGLFDFIKHKCLISKEPFFLLLPKPIYLWYSQLLTDFFKEEFGMKSYVHQIKIVFTNDLVNSNKTEQINTLSNNNKFDVNQLESEQFPDINFEFQFENDFNKLEFQEFLQNKNIKLEFEMTKHCQYSTAIKINSRGKTIVYSSDRLGKLKKSHKFFQFAQDCDLLIHECTYPDEMLAKAIEVNHSTFLQAFFNAYELNAKNLVLTHFTDKSLFYLKGFFNDQGELNVPQFQTQIKQYSQFATKPYNIDEAINYFENKVVFASDFLNFGDGNINNLSQISRIILKSLLP
ncbi:unnamed protein product [Paramecium sonneborni]|uniref:Metallo-beta-lactamase domain-containing protein n=1 Tax=Paramecium sonneborni TaxID=65129 RepID=A0A8S1NYV8_9CILI|nr:unnamed protein product [Paramecium sonneborni]